MDFFSHLLGNEPVKSYLLGMAQKERIPHSLLFAGPAGVGKTLFAEAFASLILAKNENDREKIKHGNHPDLIHFSPEGKSGMHAVDSIRHLIDLIYLPPLEASKKIFIIHSAERMLTYSSNALLKTFEEPTLHSIIILLTDRPQLLLPTIRSRCIKIPFQKIETTILAAGLQNKYNLTEEKARVLAIRAKGSFSEALLLMEERQEKARSLLFTLLKNSLFSHYGETLTCIRQINEQLEEAKKENEKKGLAQLVRSGSLADLPAAQRHLIEKEVEGAVALEYKQEAYLLFEEVVRWIRDLHLVLHSGNREFLYFPESYTFLERRVQHGSLPSIEEALKAKEELSLALERSTSFPICLESLLLRTGLLS